MADRHVTPRVRVPLPEPWGSQWRADAAEARLPVGEYLLRLLMRLRPAETGILIIHGEEYHLEVEGTEVCLQWDHDGPTPTTEDVRRRLGARECTMVLSSYRRADYRAEW